MKATIRCFDGTVIELTDCTPEDVLKLSPAPFQITYTPAAPLIPWPPQYTPPTFPWLGNGISCTGKGDNMHAVQGCTSNGIHAVSHNTGFSSH